MTFQDRQLNFMPFQTWKMKFPNFIPFRISMTRTNPASVLENFDLIFKS